MKKRLSLLAVAVLSSFGGNVAAQPVDGSLHLDSEGRETAWWERPQCHNCVAGVRG